MNVKNLPGGNVFANRSITIGNFKADSLNLGDVLESKPTEVFKFTSMSRSLADVVAQGGDHAIMSVVYNPFAPLTIMGALGNHTIIQLDKEIITYLAESTFNESPEFEQTISNFVSVEDTARFELSWHRLFYNKKATSSVGKRARSRNQFLRQVLVASSKQPESIVTYQKDMLNQALSDLPSIDLEVAGINLPVSEPIDDAFFDKYDGIEQKCTDCVELHFGNGVFALKTILESDLKDLSPDAYDHFEGLLGEQAEELLKKNNGCAITVLDLEIPTRTELVCQFDIAENMLQRYQQICLPLIPKLATYYNEMKVDELIYLTNMALTN